MSDMDLTMLIIGEWLLPFSSPLVLPCGVWDGDVLFLFYLS